MTRIIAGRAGSLRIEVPKSGTRPTSDRVREAIFSTLTSWDLVEGVHVLDLYAGSGALGLEAASRGASSVTLIERHAPAAQVAARNARTVRGAFRNDDAPSISVERQSVQAFLDAAGTTARWDVIMLDPPYDLDEPSLGANLSALVPLLDDDGVVLVERSSRSPEPVWPAGLVQVREKRYGETVLWWAEPANDERAPHPEG
ncbi:16S rRNA (guanine(966)-N(2))-methyltransferase RsmD [Leucobacter tardus]|uniref:16S rRNA (Guanine(966)-N(2))-methyltransferase RsmD n=1 Tax=Leucobacter tardus TaxID=501483 RepID=A0A939QGV6_9MICO|nr:16S rRNA (guanine(966)-N(2))-methyltransferase RsmD [Leucobacter tardus]MBO2989873.1 16S rRNA (guanine(966)-N(2))-methyltransferase RsmD [Leucobacter tardus]